MRSERRGDLRVQRHEIWETWSLSNLASRISHRSRSGLRSRSRLVCAKFTVRMSQRMVSRLLLVLSSLILSSPALVFSLLLPLSISLALSYVHIHAHWISRLSFSTLVFSRALSLSLFSLFSRSFAFSLTNTHAHWISQGIRLPRVCPGSFGLSLLPLFSFSRSLTYTHTESLKEFAFLLSILVYFEALHPSLISSKMLRARIHIEEEFLQMKCLRCRKAFYDFLGCFAIRHFFESSWFFPNVVICDRNRWWSCKIKFYVILTKTAFIWFSRLLCLEVFFKYGVATISRLLKMIGLFCKRAL